MRVRAVRGATQLEHDSRDHMLERVAEMVTGVLQANGLSVDDFISIVFTATSDLSSEFPAYAARQLGFDDVPLICARELEKTYVAEVAGVAERDLVRRLESGVPVDGQPVEVHWAKVVSTARDRSIVELTIHEGRNRIVRRLLDEVGHPVTRLTRTVIGPVVLRGLKPGQMRDLSREELGTLLDAARL